MGKSLRSKRMRANRIRKRAVNKPKELLKLKQALAFQYNEETENAHVSKFSDIVNGPLPDDGSYFEPSTTVLARTQERYENFLSRKIPKIAEIASKNLKRRIGSPERKENESDNGTTDSVKQPQAKKAVTGGDGCKPTKSGSWPVWMNQRKIRTMAAKRRKKIKSCIKREKRMNRNKPLEQRKTKKQTTKNVVKQTTNVEKMET